MADDTEETPETPDATDERRRVLIREVPPWLAAALVVVLAIAIGGVGYAIGNSDSKNNSVEPVANIQEAPNGVTRELPRGPGGLPGRPGFLPRGGEREGGEEGREGGGRCEHRDGEGNEEHGDGDDSESNGSEDDNNTPSSDLFSSPDEGAQF